MTCHWPRCRLTLYYDLKVCAYCVSWLQYDLFTQYDTFTIRSCYLLWCMICWTELSGSTFTKAIDLLFVYISLVNDKGQCHEWGGWQNPILSQDLLLNWTLFLSLVLLGHCGVLYKLNWSQMIMKRSIKTFSYGFWGFIFFFCMLSRL